MNNYSRQREIILETLKEVNIHPTAEELYKLVNRKYPKISKSTVYRNINILVESNVIRKIKMLSGADRFDYICKEHYHAICEKCGKVFDFDYSFNKNQVILSENFAKFCSFLLLYCKMYVILADIGNENCRCGCHFYPQLKF